MARVGRMWTLPAAGLLLGAPWLRPYFADPAEIEGAQPVCAWFPGGSAPLFCVSGNNANDLNTWARITTSDSYQLFCLMQMLGLVCLLFGLYALNGYLAGGRSPRWARAALILSVVGIVPSLMVLGEQWKAVPILATYFQNGINVCPTSLAEPGFVNRWGASGLCKWSLAGTFPMALTTIFLLWPGGALALAVAIWRSGLLARWVALAFGLAYYMCVWINPLVTLIGGFLMLAVGAWIAFQFGREGAMSTVRHDVVAAPTAGP